MGDYSNPQGALSFTSPGQIVGAGPTNKATYVAPFILADLFGTDPTGTSQTANDAAINAAVATLPTRNLNGNIYHVGQVWLGPNIAPSTTGANSRGGYKISQSHLNLGPFITFWGVGEEATTIYLCDNGVPTVFFQMGTPDGYISDPDTANGGGFMQLTIDARYSTGDHGLAGVLNITACSHTGSPTTLTVTPNLPAWWPAVGQQAMVMVQGLGSAGGNAQAICNGVWLATVTGANTVTIPANCVTTATPSASTLTLLGPVGLQFGEMHGLNMQCRFEHFNLAGAVALLETDTITGGGAGNEKMGATVGRNAITFTNCQFGHYRTSVYVTTIAPATFTPGTATATDLANGGNLPGLTCTQINGSTSPVAAGTSITSVQVTTGPTFSISTNDLIRLSTGGTNPTYMWLNSNSNIAVSTTATMNLVASSGHASHIGGDWTYIVAKLNGGSAGGEAATTTTTTAQATLSNQIPVLSTASVNPGMICSDNTTAFPVSGDQVIVNDVDPSTNTVTVSSPVTWGLGDTIDFTMPTMTNGGQTVLQFDTAARGQIVCDNSSYTIFGNASSGSGAGAATIVGINLGGTGGSGSTWYGTDLNIKVLEAGGWGSNGPIAFQVVGSQAAYWVGNANINLQPGGIGWTASTGIVNGSGVAGNAGLFTCWSGQSANGDTTLNSKVVATYTGTPTGTLTNSYTNYLSITLGPGMWDLEVEGSVKGGAGSTQNIEMYLATISTGPYTGASTLDCVEIQPALSQWLPFRLNATPQVANPNGGTTQTFYLNSQSSASNSAILENTSSVNSNAKITRMIATPA